MSKKIVYICSPCRGDYEKNIQQAKNYCREVMTKWPDVVPIAPHIYLTQFLDDTKPTERSLGLDAGIALLEMCDELWVYGLDNPSEGMAAEIEYAHLNGIPIRDGFNPGDLVVLEQELGDMLLVLPLDGDSDSAAAVTSMTVRISGEVIAETTKALRRNRGRNITVEAEA